MFIKLIMLLGDPAPGGPRPIWWLTGCAWTKLHARSKCALVLNKFPRGKPYYVLWRYCLQMYMNSIIGMHNYKNLEIHRSVTDINVPAGYLHCKRCQIQGRVATAVLRSLKLASSVPECINRFYATGSGSGLRGCLTCAGDETTVCVLREAVSIARVLDEFI